MGPWPPLTFFGDRHIEALQTLQERLTRSTCLQHRPNNVKQDRVGSPPTQAFAGALRINQLHCHVLLRKDHRLPTRAECL